MPNPARPLAPLPPHPSDADLRAAVDAGMTYPAWCDAGKPRVNKTAAVNRNGACEQKPAFRPWHPYRSKWEKAYAEQLELLKLGGFIADWEYEPERLLIGVGAFYTPDFRVTTIKGRRDWHEVKGYRREASIVRIKAAALRYLDQRFVIVTRQGTGWVHTPIGVKP